MHTSIPAVRTMSRESSMRAADYLGKGSQK
jgi:hypothetical protein